MDTAIRTLVPGPARLGECVLWCDRSQAVFWTDIEAARLWRWSAATGQARSWTLPDKLGSFALCDDPRRLLLGLASGIAIFDLEAGAVGEIVPVEPHLPTTRINDGRCDRQGRFVFGTFNLARGGEAIGAFYRVGADLRVERLPLPAVTVANGIAFSPDGERMYFADSPTRTIQCVAYHAEGTLGAPRPFVRFADGDGFPDGACVDAQGGLWSAHWDGGCVVRYGPDGEETDRIALPVQRPTCVALGGAGLDLLLVSTATVGLKAEQLQAQPQAGAILATTVRHRGLPESRFALSGARI